MTARLAIVVFVCLPLMACSGGQVSEDDSAKSVYHYRLARNYYNDRNMAMTQRELHTSLGLDPKNAVARYLKGFVAQGLKDYPTASRELEQAIALDPELLEARNNLGTVYLAQERYADAITTLMPLLENPLYPTPAFAHGNVAWGYYKLGDLENARKHLDMAVFLNPRFCLGFNNLGLVLQEMKNLRAARNAFEKAIKVCPDKYAEAYYNLGVLMQESGEFDGATVQFRKCAEIAPDTSLGQRCAVRAGEGR